MVFGTTNYLLVTIRVYYTKSTCMHESIIKNSEDI